MQVRDSTGAVIPGAIVTLLLDVNPTGAIITGNSATADVNGFSQFPALTIDRVWYSGYVIRAEVGGTVVAITSPFNILEACLAGGVFTVNQISVEGPGIVSLPIVTRVGANFDNDGFPTRRCCTATASSRACGTTALDPSGGPSSSTAAPASSVRTTWRLAISTRMG